MRKTSPVSLVLALSDTARLIDVSGLDGAVFRRRFNGFYGVRRNPAWQAVFYSEFQRLKAVGDHDLSEIFTNLLDAVAAQTGRIEASFVSKAVSALRGDGPIIDSVVRTRLAAIMAPPRFGGGREQAIVYYEWLYRVFDGLGRTSEGLAWGEAFDVAFADIPGAASLHIHRKLDFLIWGGRAAPLEGVT